MIKTDTQFACIMDTPIGKLGIKMQNGKVTAVDFLPDTTFTVSESLITPQLNAYFSNAHYTINLPVAPAGTSFQQRVWKALCDIPAGTTLTYGALAKKLNSSPRAVGQACRRNPIPVIIPCHRVTGAKGLGGYAGETSGNIFEVKKWLLEFERQGI